MIKHLENEYRIKKLEPSTPKAEFENIKISSMQKIRDPMEKTNFEFGSMLRSRTYAPNSVRQKNGNEIVLERSKKEENAPIKGCYIMQANGDSGNSFTSGFSRQNSIDSILSDKEKLPLSEFLKLLNLLIYDSCDF